MPKYSPIFVRLFKEEAELEVWKQDTTGRFQILKTYPICRWSGDLVPKYQKSERLAGEVFIPIRPKLLDHSSNFHLAINVGYTNRDDKATARSGHLPML